MEKQYKMPAIVWLKMTDYMHGWLQWGLGGALRVRSQKVISVQHLPGARDILMMETVGELSPQLPVGSSMSATWKNCIMHGLTMDPVAVKNAYGVSEDGLKLFVPVECPKMTLTKNGVLRPWTNDVNLSSRQAHALQQLLRDAFWQAVGEFNDDYARRMRGKKYPAVDMIEAFCKETGTPDLHVEAIRREWQRRVKRAASPPERG